MRFIAALLALFLAFPLVADVVDDVRRTEIAFAKAFADRDKETFFSFVAEDATFLSPWITLRGKQAVMRVWSRFFEGPVAPFSWAPDRVSLAGDGSLALSSGPIFGPNGEHQGSFMSTWQKQKDGSWKVVFDGSGAGPAVFASDAVNVEEGDITTADGVRLHYRKAGNAPQVLIVPLDHVLFDAMKQFADIATVIAYDPRSRARSSRAPVSASTIEDDVRDLESVRAHFKADKFVPVGFSYLGKMVMLYAAAHPDRVQRIIQLGPVGNRVIAPQRDAGFGASKELLEQWQSMQASGAAEKTPREFCEVDAKVMSHLLVEDDRKAVKVPFDCSLENEWPMNFGKHMAALFPSVMSRVLSEDELQKITMPVLTIHGAKDRNAPHEGGRAWVASLRDARLVTLDGAAHAMWIDDPAGTFGAIRAFLRRDEPLGSERINPPSAK
jgi:pimeloyl-ACP methyl ester carboxylesterase/ketosteroid isomerase-like protein